MQNDVKNDKNIVFTVANSITIIHKQIVDEDYEFLIFESVDTHDIHLQYTFTKNEKEEQCCYIVSAFVDKKLRGKGITLEIFERLLDFYPTVDKFTLHCTLSSRKFWEKLGFSFSKDYFRRYGVLESTKAIELYKKVQK